MMGAFLTYIFPAMLPALSDGFRGLVARFAGAAGGHPQNVAERVQLMSAETAKIEALAKLDNPIGQPSQWVVDVRAAFRYAAITLIWLVTAGAVFSHQSEMVVLVLLDMSGASLSFIIGERFYLKVKS